MNSIEVKSVNYGYTKEKQILKDVSFNITKGEFVTILGHNGCGKSTLAKLLAGLLMPFEGSVFINGNELKSENLSRIRKDIVLVFQNPDNQFIASTVEDDIAFGLENHLVPREEMKDIIIKYATSVGMEEFLNKEPFMLSGGQKQRVAIAGALAIRPNIIIFDESTSMLDPKGKADVLSLIAKLRKENPDLTILSISHNVDESLTSDRIVVMNQGKVVRIGTPGEIFRDDKLIEECHLQKPFAVQLVDALKASGLDVSDKNTEDDLVEVYALCHSNPLYYSYCPPMVTMEELREELSACPPNISLDHKYYVGFYQENRLIALMDLIDGYPSEDIAWIGFFMVDANNQRKGVGTDIIQNVLHFLKENNASFVRLAWVTGNPQASSFWQKNGFEPIKETTSLDGRNVILAQKQL